MFYSMTPEDRGLFQPDSGENGESVSDAIDYDKLADKIALRLFAMLVTAKQE